MLIKLIVVGYLTRTLTPEEFGVLGFGTALASYFIFSLTLGLDRIGTREVARGKRSVPVLAGQITRVRIGLSVLSLVLFVGVVFILPHPTNAKLVFLVQGAALPFYALNVEWIYEGVQRMGLVAVRRILADVLYVAGVFLLVKNEGDVILAAAASSASFALGVLWLFSTYFKDFKSLPLFATGIQWRSLARTTLPFAISLFLLSVFTNFDKIMLGLMKDSTDVGYYEAALRLYAVATAPVMIIVSAFYPILSQSVDDPVRRQTCAESLARIQLSLGPLVGAAGLILAEPLIVLLAGEAYRLASPVVGVLMLSSVVVFASGAIAQPLLAWNQEKRFLWAVLSGVLINILLNLLFISTWGMLGAAWATIIGGVTVIVAAAPTYFLLAQYNPLNDLLRGLLAAAFACGIPAWTAHHFQWPWPLLLAVLVLSCMLALAVLQIPKALAAIQQPDNAEQPLTDQIP